MKQFFFFLCLGLGWGAATQAQEISYMWQIQAGDSRYVFTDTAYVRTGADTRQAIADTLFAGDEITIREITDKPLTLKGFTAPWLQITYKKDSVEKTGFLWQGLISFTQMRRGDTRFVFGVDRRFVKTVKEGGETYEESEYLIKLKAVVAGQLLSAMQRRGGGDGSFSYAESKVMSGLGLTNVKNIVVLTLSGEACGVPTNYFYYAWMNDNRLVALPDRSDVGDADVYYHSEKFLFPAEKGGQPDQILLTIEEGTNEDDKRDKAGNAIMTIKKSSKQYTWDGTSGTFRALP
ncbi:hypothetical protein [Chitinophaga nivalis]|uniref:SH3b domain-containing protein n=1 Tax=Chitinophaga nivalis TaxID=2991709 RepID=A0ABT3IQB4_9BACT|nr:hypothetical protein [Chitinophaga nivalis]MCW3464146.1 hypothetical protein [Chitinophaga nivalis]MCW3486164.1 hypothetical protein [Chitinophaga nivalis]